jgi:hypothetical protein
MACIDCPLCREANECIVTLKTRADLDLLDYIINKSNGLILEYAWRFNNWCAICHGDSTLITQLISARLKFIEFADMVYEQEYIICEGWKKISYTHHGLHRVQVCVGLT